MLAGVLKVDTVAPDRHFITDLGADSLLMAKFCARVRKRPGLPPVSIKDTYRHPTINALAEALAPARPEPRPGTPEVAGEFAAVLAEVLKVDTVAPDRHFITDLGADSLLMAKFCARVRKRPGLPPVSIKDTYRHPTINALAEALAPATESRAGTRAPVSRAAPDPAPLTISLPRYHLCGLLQLLAFLGLVSVATSVHGPGLPVDRRRPGPAGRVRAVGDVRQRDVRGRLPGADPGQVDVDRPLDAAADPGVEPGLPAVLAGQDADQDEPAGPLRRHPAVLALPARARREDRPGRGRSSRPWCRCAPTC